MEKKGLAAKAASRLLKYCFEYWQLKEVYLLCSSENMASVKTALACGFTKMSSIEVPIQNSVFLQDIVEHCLNDRACVSTSLLFCSRGRLFKSIGSPKRIVIAARRMNGK